MTKEQGDVVHAITQGLRYCAEQIWVLRCELTGSDREYAERAYSAALATVERMKILYGCQFGNHPLTPAECSQDDTCELGPVGPPTTPQLL